jgi:hypothetical protein
MRARAVPGPLPRTAGGAGASLVMSDAHRGLAQEQTASLDPLGPDASGPDSMRALESATQVCATACEALPTSGRFVL